MSIDDFEKIRLLGKGSFAKVFLMKCKSNGKIYAVKVIHKYLMTKENKQYQVNAEREVLATTNHFNIIKLYYSFRDERKLYFALEYAPNGELRELLDIARTFDYSLAQYYTAEIVNMLEYLHSKGIVHQDLKPGNILLDTDWHLKLADFGTAKFLGRDSGKENRDFVGTAEYVSPEVLMDKDTTTASDLWALGCMIYEFLVGKPPFDAKTEYWTFEAIMNGKFDCPSTMDPDAVDICKQLLVVDPAKRLGNDYSLLKAHKFFTGIDFNNLKNTKPPISQELIEKITQARVINANDKYSVLNEDIILKKCGWLFYKKRKIVLTSEPKISYYDPKTNAHRGDIILNKDAKAVKTDMTKFDIITAKKIFCFKGLTAEKTDTWVENINSIIEKISIE